MFHQFEQNCKLTENLTENEKVDVSKSTTVVTLNLHSLHGCTLCLRCHSYLPSLCGIRSSAPGFSIQNRPPSDKTLTFADPDAIVSVSLSFPVPDT